MSNYTMTAVTTVVVAVAGAEVARMAAEKAGKPVKDVMAPVIAGFTLGLFLFAFGMASERLATLLCLLIVVGSLLVNGPHLFAILNPKK